jgi:hypothetical protein
MDMDRAGAFVTTMDSPSVTERVGKMVHDKLALLPIYARALDATHSRHLRAPACNPCRAGTERGEPAAQRDGFDGVSISDDDARYLINLRGAGSSA